MTGISQARQRLRDYAREDATVAWATQREGDLAPTEQRICVGLRGEHAGKAFEAIQDALTVAEELREESRAPDNVVEVGGRRVTFPEAGSYKDALAAAADRIEAAVLKALS